MSRRRRAKPPRPRPVNGERPRPRPHGNTITGPSSAWPCALLAHLISLYIVFEVRVCLGYLMDQSQSVAQTHSSELKSSETGPVFRFAPSKTDIVAGSTCWLVKVQPLGGGGEGG